MAEDEGTGSDPGQQGSGNSSSSPDHVTKTELEHHLAELRRERQQLRDEVSELHSTDKKERDEMRQEISALTAYINELEEAEKKRDEVKSSKSTMVLPPSDIPPQQPNPAPPTGEPSPGEPERKKRLSWW